LQTRSQDADSQTVKMGAMMGGSTLQPVSWI
jgi:hypothetical protein